MKVAILGAGFAGLAVTWYLLNYTQGSITVDLFDPEPIGGGASGLSSGLLHPFTGRSAKKAWEAERSLKETHRLMTEASRAINKPVILSKGILRPAVDQQQIDDFQMCAQTHHKETQWLDKKECEARIAGLQLPQEGGGLFIKEGLTIDVKTYLQGLWQACALLGTQFHQQRLISNEDLAPFERILIAMGPMARNFPPLKDLPIEAVKGQILELKWPPHLQPLPHSLVGQKYIVMSGDYKSCFVGSTYEHQFDSPLPDQEKAYQEIMPKILSFFPALEEAEVLNCKTAFRASSPNHLPLLGKISDQAYFFTGLGSKGLLYHAWLGKRIARTLLTTDPKHIPDKVHYNVKPMLQ